MTYNDEGRPYVDLRDCTTPRDALRRIEQFLDEHYSDVVRTQAARLVLEDHDCAGHLRPHCPPAHHAAQREDVAPRGRGRDARGPAQHPWTGREMTDGGRSMERTHQEGNQRDI